MANLLIKIRKAISMFTFKTFIIIHNDLLKVLVTVKNEKIGQSTKI